MSACVDCFKHLEENDYGELEDGYCLPDIGFICVACEPARGAGGVTEPAEQETK